MLFLRIHKNEMSRIVQAILLETFKFRYQISKFTTNVQSIPPEVRTCLVKLTCLMLWISVENFHSVNFHLVLKP